MKKFLAAVSLSLFMLGVAHTEEAYDPQNTILALNMAIVSVNKILATQDRAVLEWEYDNIINRLAFGNIESDPEMIELYRELLDFINGKKLRQEDSQRLRESYERRQKEAYYRAMYDGFASLRLIPTENMQSTSQVSRDESGYTVSGSVKVSWAVKATRAAGSYSKQESHMLITQDPFLPLLSWAGNISISAVSSIGMSYYGYWAERERIHSEIQGGLWQLQKEEIEACHELQMRLLNSSWRLLRQYKLPDEYRLTEATLTKFFKAVETEETADRLKMLKMIERDFKAYPQYWFYRAQTAFDAGEKEESEHCFDIFNEVWRPVLRKDCYKVEVAKYQISRIVKQGRFTKEVLDEIHRLADTIKGYAPDDDWSSNLFAGFVYFALGDKDNAVMCVEENILFGYEKDISGAVLEEMRKTDKDFTFKDINDEIRKLEIERRKTEFIASGKDDELKAVLTQYFASCDVEVFAGFECLMREEMKESKQYFRELEEYCDCLFIIGTMYAKGLEVEKDYRRASAYYEEAAWLGHLQSQFELGNLYYDGGHNLERDYMEAFKWYQVVAYPGIDGDSEEPESEGHP